MEVFRADENDLLLTTFLGVYKRKSHCQVKLPQKYSVAEEATLIEDYPITGDLIIPGYIGGSAPINHGQFGSSFVLTEMPSPDRNIC